MPRYALVATGPGLGDIDIDIIAGADLGSPDILAPARACQWRVEETRDTGAIARRDALRAAIGQCPVDINLVRDDALRRKRLLLADMDSTIIGQECIDEIAQFAGVGDSVAAITERAMRGELDFEEALTERVGLLKGLSEDALEKVAAERLTITPGARELIATMRHHGAYCILVSGGFTFFTSRIAATVGFDENRANTLEIVAGRLTGNPVHPILGREAKRETLIECTAKFALPPDATLAVGDGANDLAMIEAAGLGVAFRAKPLVNQAADAQVQHGDLRDLLFLQGYRHDEIVAPSRQPTS